ncbi:DUF58 domain-containing protein [Sulfidibacter corallicola]|uniref:DUF58 domain-containing protein n=1 Tax=Sulfidibacter corallicola TaxID=2818388 RepID=A0A8A4TM22_SULCO|nr:DUF58 domain-containing protein [Sulfidibacter corallicola]QTD51006.1 DUF58 domain-containing protein [Sulfidibacter corallicola]
MRPTRRTLRLWGAVLGLAVLVGFFPALRQPWLVVVLVAGTILAIDALRARALPLPKVVRKVPHALALGAWTEVHLRVEGPGSHALTVDVHDFHPPQCQTRDLPLQVALVPGQWREMAYRLKPVTRGDLTFGKTQVLLGSPFGFWHRSAMVGEPSEVRVYPNFQAVAKYTLLATHQRLSQLGIHRRQRRGEGREFHQLREFVQGDSMRQIDWKASSRMRKLISREHQDERNQQVVFLMDCGQTMRTQDGQLSHFDHALNAVLLMTHVALRHGDAVGLMTFSGGRRWLAPRKGAPQLNLILDRIYDIQPGHETSDFLGVAQQVLRHVRKRSLIVLITNLRDEDDGELLPALQLLRRKHLVLVASMREQVLDEVVEGSVTDLESGLRLAATHLYMADREQIYQQLKQKNVLSLDVTPEMLPVSMINSYLEVKGSGLL